MRTGIAGEILAAPQEALIFYTLELKRAHPGIISNEHIDLVRRLIQEKIYYEPIMRELFEHIPVDYYRDYIEQYSPEKRTYRFTDDTTLSIAIMDALLILGKEFAQGNPLGTKEIVKASLLRWGNKYLEVGYGKHFKKFLTDPDAHTGQSIGNGAAMRTAAIGYTYDSSSYLITARKSAAVSHGHPEAIRGALAVTDAVAQALKPGATKTSIKDYLEQTYFYDLDQTLESIRPTYKFYSDAQRSVPQAIIAFLESTNQVTAVENTISLGGDTDTQAMIAGCIADAFYGYETIPLSYHQLVSNTLPQEMIEVLHQFEERYVLNRD